MAGYRPSSFFACLWTETKSMYIFYEKLNHCIILQAYVVTVQSLSRMSSLFHSKESSERTRKHENL